MAKEQAAVQIVDDWYNALDLYQDKLPSKGSIAAALHVLSRLRTNYDLNIAAHVADGEAQITGLSGASLKKVLAEFGESRVLSSVAGRSNRGARGDVAKLLEAMRPLRLENDSEERERCLVAMQRHIVTNYVSLFFSVKRVKATFDANSSMWRMIGTILSNARASGKWGAIAEYLVGAKLSLRFPEKEIRNKRFSESDAQGGFSGDFEIGDTVFHVTVAPMPELFEKLKVNIERGVRAFLIVADSQVVGARQNAEAVAAGRIAVESIESFVSTNVEELAEFDGSKLKSGFRRLLEKYNERVDAIELDKSLMIEIPPNLD